MARLLTLLFEVTELFDMQTRPELLLVQKTMVVVEGVARTLDPDFDMWAASEPVVRDWIERYLGPAGQLELAAEGVGALGRLVNELPRLAERAERLSAEMDRMGEHGLRLDPETVASIGRSEARCRALGPSGAVGDCGGGGRGRREAACGLKTSSRRRDSAMDIASCI